MNQTTRNIFVFTIIVVLCGWLGVFVDSFLTEQPEGNTLGMGIWLVFPMLTAIVLILYSKISWKEIGIKPNFKGNLRWYLISVLIFPAVTVTILVIGNAFKWIDMSELNLRTFTGVFFSTILIGFIKNIFEETVWRGFLTSQLVKLNLTDWKIYLLVGSVWGIWHVPYYMMFLPETDMQVVLPVSRIIFTVVAILTMICWSIMFIELYRITNSIWPCVLLHTVEDSLINPLVISGFISISSGKEIVISPICGVITSLLYLSVGLAIKASRRRQTKVQSTVC
ncbi:CPBP family intramembrane glutamic endopeptidase [Paenibacillus gallinarum]|nr:CPBP family intramembrane glutamic endopeptidase [Paenibacillus gallinarum]